MDSSSLFILLSFSLLVLLLDVPHSHSQPWCHQEERNALLEFKATFEESCLEPWTGDCCHWYSVTCDEHSGHVTGLDLARGCLSGSINSNSSIFKLTHLQTLDLSDNDFRYSNIPFAISNLSRLETLFLIGSNFSGQIPLEILNLTNLSYLYLEGNPLILKNPSLRDLVQSFVKLKTLDLGNVEISSSLPDSLSRLTFLQELVLSNCKLQGQVFPLVTNLTKLEILDLSYNQFTGEIFPHLFKLPKLKYVCLSYNKFFGQIPRTISHLKNLSSLIIDSNNFNGKIHLEVFFQLNSLKNLDLSHNNFSFVIHSSIIKPKLELQQLALVSCNLRRFPLLLQNLDSLHILDLSSNDISGEIPTWICDMELFRLFLSNNSLLGLIPQCLIGTTGSYLNVVDLSHNHLLGFEGNFPLLQGSLEYLDLRFNQVKGSLPIPSTNSFLQFYLLSNNEFSGQLPIRICDFVNLEVFDIGNNSLSGEIPQCLINLVGIGNLSVLNLYNNNFSGPIPRLGKSRCNLIMIDMSHNQLEGPVPKDMENCLNLEFLNLGNNRIIDGFPFWLGKLPNLSVLILRSNRLHGIIGKPSSGNEFRRLQIINLSNNNFSGYLPTQYFEGWMAMKVDAHKQDQTILYASYGDGDYFFTVTITEKGIDLEYTKIPKSLAGVDLSCNYFIGEIPRSIATLKELYFLNLSNNMLTGLIPLNLNDLKNLESLDLSNNKLSGEIPQQLTDLTTLESFDVSFNQLTGRIPRSNQFNTFGSTSYQGNPGLCGPPLVRKCGNTINASPPPSLEKDHSWRAWIEIDWKIVSMGYTSGFVIGVVMGMNWTRGCKKLKRVGQIKFILN